MPVILARVAGVRHPEVEAALQREWPDYEEWIIDPADDFEYGELIREAWTGDDDLVIVEQDVVAPPGSIQRLLDCTWPWCAHETWLGLGYSPRTLGLVKLSAKLQREDSELVRRAIPGSNESRPPVHWRSVDAAMVRALEFAGCRVHPHYPEARHLHRYPGSPPADPAPATPGRPA